MITGHPAPPRPVVGQRHLLEALMLLAVDPGLGGAVLLGPLGSGRRTLAAVYRTWVRPGAPFVEAPADGDWATFQGSLDWEATLRLGRPVHQPGLWEQARGGTLFLHRGEDMPPAVAAWLGRSLSSPNPPILLLSATPSASVTAADPWYPLTPRLAFVLPLDPLAAIPEREAILAAAELPAPGLSGHPRETLHREGTSSTPENLSLQARIDGARARLPQVTMPSALLRRICRESHRLGLAHPALERLVMRAAKARAALHERQHVVAEDVTAAVRLVLELRQTEDHHSARPASDGNEPPDRQPTTGSPNRGAGSTPTRDGQTPTRSGTEAPLQDAPGRDPGLSSHEGWALNEVQGDGGISAGRPNPTSSRGASSPEAGRGSASSGMAQVYRAVEEARHHRLAARWHQALRESLANPRPTQRGSYRNMPSADLPAARGTGLRRAMPCASTGRRGFVIPTQDRGVGISLSATIRASLPHQPFRIPRPGMAVRLAPEDLRHHRRSSPPTTLFILAVDGSGSMGAARSRTAKGLARALLRRAYVQRAHVALIRVAGRKPQVILPPSRSGLRAQRALDAMPTGGGTPLAGALATMENLARRYRRRSPQAEVVGLLLTDGRANVPLGRDTDPARIVPELQGWAARLRRGGIHLAVLDRDHLAAPADDARRLADLLGCPFLEI